MPQTVRKSGRRYAREAQARENSAGGALPAEGSAKPPRHPSKLSLIAGLLSRNEGASLNELVVATGWQPHTTRAALTALRKKGQSITKAKLEGVTRYSIAAAAQP